MKFSIQNGSVTLSGNTILEEINFEISASEHVGIVGKNGAGKTTLINAIIDNELLDQGCGDKPFKITKIGEFNIGYLKQIEFDPNELLINELLKPFDDLIQLEKKIDKLSSNLNTTDDVNLYNKLMDDFKYRGGYTYKKDIEVMLNKFGFQSEDKNKCVKEFSGGERTKLAFIKLLLLKPDLLILDEPTNHLDITSIMWLEEYLANYKGAIILVSHDRMFLDNVVNVIYDIDYGETIKYKSNYTNYVKMKEERYNKILKDYNAQQEEIKRLNNIYLRFRNKPTKAKMALSKLRQIEKMDIIDKPNSIETKTFKVNLNNIKEPAKIVLKMDNLTVGYDKVLANINLDIKRGTKLGIIGKNGSGKSTLLKTINGILNPLGGTISYGLNTKSGYFDQNLSFLTNGSIITEFRAYINDMTLEESRNALGSFLFKGDDIYKELDVLSGGEKVRLQLCKILYNKPNILLLDEPTNHLDIASKTYLESILKDYEGTIIFVSHDRYFVNNIASELLVFEEDGSVNHYKYGYQEYLNRNVKDNITYVEKHEKKIKEEKVEVKRDLKKELSKVENEIIKINNKIDKLTEELFTESVYNDYNKSNSINELIKELKEELASKEETWENITDLMINN